MESECAFHRIIFQQRLTPANFFQYFRGQVLAGNQQGKPRLVQRQFPKTGQFPNSILATPRAADVNGDGLLDLVVSASYNIYIYLNVGTKTHPVFAAHATPLRNKSCAPTMDC